MTAAAAAAPAAPARRAPAPRPKKPLIALVRSGDGRALSFSERLAELRHKQFKHTGPICHRCRMSASALALASAPRPLAS